MAPLQIRKRDICFSPFLLNVSSQGQLGIKKKAWCLHIWERISPYSKLLLIPRNCYSQRSKQESTEFECRVVLWRGHIFFQVQLQCKHNILCGWRRRLLRMEFVPPLQYVHFLLHSPFSIQILHMVPTVMAEAHQ